ncbi:MAG: MBL fold metallo-hydrolase [Chloroflexota bacterium]|nr:MBL fold metallo-hydrolase [Chloroflexota bacterium]
MTDLLEDEFGDIIGKARFGLNLSAEDVAAQVGISTEELAVLEDCERTPTRAESDALAAALNLDSQRLLAVARDAYVPDPVPLDHGGVRIRVIPYPPMRVYQYVVGDVETGQAVVVDPGAEPDRILGALADEQWSAAAVLVTHADADHIDALPAIHAALSVPIWVHPNEQPRMPALEGADVRTYDHGQCFQAGPFEVEARRTPGHAPGHSSLVLRDLVLVGDAMFAGSLGRTSLGPAYYAEHLAAVRSQILTLPAATRLFPGHGPPTTVGQELAHNPFFAP